MTLERAKLYAELLLAYSNGATIEVQFNYNTEPSTWQVANINNLVDYANYRIKPQPKLVPFTFEDKYLFRNKFISLNPRSAIFRVNSINASGISVNGIAGNTSITYKQLFNDYLFEDGSKCGKYVSE